MTAPCVELCDVGFRYPGGDFALDIPSLAIAEGERVACVGPSGSGKSTLVNIIAGVILPERGRVIVDGDDVTGLAENERRARRIRTIGMVFQEFELLDYLTALENILLPYRVSGALKLDRDVVARARELARTVGVEALLGRLPARLSQGERQRVALCRALLTEPSLVLCDEPTGNLDRATATGAIDLVFEQADRHGAAVLVVSHDHDIIARFDRVVDVREFTGGAVT